METTDWTPCAVDRSQLDLEGPALQSKWAALHMGNHEPYPADEALQNVWRLYHLGHFADGVAAAETLGDAGLTPLAFCATIHAHYVEQDEKLKADIFGQTIALCEQARARGFSSANFHYMYAVTLGRYSQTMTPLEALTDGLVARMKEQIDLCLAIDDRHAEALATLAGWHAAITTESGEMMARMMYGATEEAAIELYEKAVQCAPDSPVPYIEFAQGLEKLYGAEGAVDRIRANLQKGLGVKPIDAMQQLDAKHAAALLANLA
ncbi:MAG TPA: hypothetical protein PKB14_00265 [Rubrivivax sp.]|nr:hypothetical protein [Rubrivivax sp.]